MLVVKASFRMSHVILGFVTVCIHITLITAHQPSGMSHVVHAPPHPPTYCLHSTTLAELITCLRPFLRPANTSASPLLNQGQRASLQAVVTQVLSQPHACLDDAPPLPPQLSHMVLSRFPLDTLDDPHTCVLMETTTTEHGWFEKGWGTWAVRIRTRKSSASSSASGRPALTLHVSSPHPLADGRRIDVQAATVYDGSPAAMTLLVSGHHRQAASTDSSCEPGHPISDPPYNKHDFISVVSQATMQWTVQQSHALAQHGVSTHSHMSLQPQKVAMDRASGAACRLKTMWLQLHGKAETSCPQSTVFLSAGLDNTTCPDLYLEDSGSPVARMVQALRKMMPAWGVHTPASPNGIACPLRATRNVFGRFLNGVPMGECCSRAARFEDIAQAPCGGTFVHAEQASDARDPASWPAWVAAVNAACA